MRAYQQPGAFSPFIIALLVVNRFCSVAASNAKPVRQQSAQSGNGDVGPEFSLFQEIPESANFHWATRLECQYGWADVGVGGEGYGKLRTNIQKGGAYT
jgi:hypothetical protein